jgi:hypothetical protein
MVSTDYTSDMGRIAAHMFTRWSQENFFRSMMEHDNIDRLMDYQTVNPDETMKGVNPAHRAMESQIKSKTGQRNRKQAEFGALSLQESANAKEMTSYEYRKGSLKEQIDDMEREIGRLKEERKQTPRHIGWKDLPEPERFQQLSPARKQLMDAIRMIAYRAETALTLILRESLARSDDARSLAREIFTTEADLIPNEKEKTLTVRLHHLPNRISDEAARHLAQHLNDSETVYPGADLRLVYKLVSDDIPTGQEF